MYEIILKYFEGNDKIIAFKKIIDLLDKLKN
jgi:hypothetical protein